MGFWALLDAFAGGRTFSATSADIASYMNASAQRNFPNCTSTTIDVVLGGAIAHPKMFGWTSISYDGINGKWELSR